MYILKVDDKVENVKKIKNKYTLFAQSGIKFGKVSHAHA